MRKFEYKETNYYHSRTLFMDMLDHEGQKGWELVSIQNNPSGNYGIMKRQILRNPQKSKGEVIEKPGKT